MAEKILQVLAENNGLSNISDLLSMNCMELASQLAELKENSDQWSESDWKAALAYLHL